MSKTNEIFVYSNAKKQHHNKELKAIFLNFDETSNCF